jgi:hypothetical protein
MGRPVGGGRGSYVPVKALRVLHAVDGGAARRAGQSALGAPSARYSTSCFPGHPATGHDGQTAGASLATMVHLGGSILWQPDWAFTPGLLAVRMGRPGLKPCGLSRRARAMGWTPRLTAQTWLARPLLRRLGVRFRRPPKGALLSEPGHSCPGGGWPGSVARGLKPRAEEPWSSRGLNATVQSTTVLRRVGVLLRKPPAGGCGHGPRVP